MNYPRTLAKSKTILEQQHCAQTVQTAAGAFKSLLVAQCNELLGQLPPAR